MKSFALTLSPAHDMDEAMFTKICKIFDNLKWEWLGCRELAKKWHCHFAILAPYANSSAFGKKVRTVLQTHFEEFGDISGRKSISIFVKTWYVGGDGYEPLKDTGGSEHKTWEDYIKKDGTYTYGEHWRYQEGVNDWDNVRESILEPNKPKDQQKNHKTVWATMTRWESHFKQLDLPFKYIDQIEMGISNICFKHKLESMPNKRDLYQLRDYLWLYLNEYEGNAFAWLEQTHIELDINRKRKRFEIEGPADLEIDSKEYQELFAGVK